MRETTRPTAPLPKEWPAVVKTGLLEVVALARLAVLDAVAGFAEGTLDTRQKARIAVLERERQLLLRSCASRTRG